MPMEPKPDFSALSTERLLEPVAVPLLTLIEIYKLLIGVALDGEADRPETYRLATALLAVITAAETG
jgi:hypothetical protein